ncbi:methyltransferase domain-containing protein [Candidatus Acetothermia bacterium]|nr:methyltransferase domain-containing protein [Candidatus Acetothermia bacterium]
MSEFDFSFKAFAQQPFYKEVNRLLVNLSNIQPGQKVIDLACGAGTVTRLIMEKLQGARESFIIVLDSSSEALRLTKEELGQFKSNVVEFVQGHAEQVSQLVRDRVDAIFLCNAIHMIEDKKQLISGVASRLQKGGIFAFNTTFFDGSQLPETEQFYRRWMLRSLRILKRKYDLMPDRAEKVEARKQLTVDDYLELLHAHQLEIREHQMQKVLVPLEGWLAISQFADFVNGAMPKVPVAQASDALQQGLREVFEELQLTAVPRNWWLVIAARSA